MKKIIAILLCVVLIISVIPTAAFAQTEGRGKLGRRVFSQKKYKSYGAIQTLEGRTDVAALEATLFEGFYDCDAQIDISSFNLLDITSHTDALAELVFNEMATSFHVDTFYYYYNTSTNKITKIEPEYLYSRSTYQSMYSQFIAESNEILSGIKNNSNLSDVQKALLLHDRLAMTCEYDFNDGTHQYECYGALVEGKAVCQGYTEAYDYLLEQVGIESYTCTSDSLNHIWNIIYINNRPYHVDVTWDDQNWGSKGRGVVGAVSHENFLRSSNGIYATGHKASDYDTFPTSTTYDSYFWQNSNSAFQLIGNEIYYVDNKSASIKRYGSSTELYTLTADWQGSNGTNYGNMTCLSSDGQYLYCSLSKSIHRCSVTETSHSNIYAPSLSGYENIYGFEYKDGYLICDINTLSYSTTSTTNLRQIKYAYNTNAASTSTLTANAPYNASITSGGQVKYYTFTPSTSGNYVIYSLCDYDTKVALYNSSGSLLDSDDDGGEGSNFRLEYYLNAGTTYKFGVQYYSSSKTGSIPFKFGNVFTVTYNANGGSYAPATQSKDYGQSITLSSTTPVREGYNFKGWATSSTATTASYQPGDVYSGEANVTLYAVWELIHTHTYKIIITPATLSKDGKAVKQCTGCGRISSQRVISKIKSVSLTTTNYAYNGKAKTPGVKVADSAGKTVSSKYYTVTYASGRKNVGTYKVTVKFKGEYSGSKTVTFNVKPSTKASAIVVKGGTYKIGAKSNKKITYSTSNKKIATVNSSGTITGVKAGTATITVKSNGISQNIKVTVQNPYVKISGSTSMVLKKSVTLKATSNTTAKVNWSSSNSKIAKVSSSGKVTGQAVGKATIYAKITFKGKTYSASYKVTVKSPSLTLSKTSATLYVGNTYKLTVTTSPSATVKYKTSNKKVATVTSSGKITAVAKGTATITAYFEYAGKTYSKTCKVTVNNMSGYTQLKNYITKYGFTDSYGYKTIGGYLDDTYYYVTYNTSKNCLEFLMFCEGYTEYSVSFDYKENQSYIDVTMDIAVGSSSTAEVTYRLKVNSYNNDSGFTYYITTRGLLDPDDYHDLVGSLNDLAFSGWNLLLLTEGGSSSFNKIGFTNFYT